MVKFSRTSLFKTYFTFLNFFKASVSFVVVFFLFSAVFLCFSFSFSFLLFFFLSFYLLISYHKLRTVTYHYLSKVMISYESVWLFSKFRSFPEHHF